MTGSRYVSCGSPIAAELRNRRRLDHPIRTISRLHGPCRICSRHCAFAEERRDRKERDDVVKKYYPESPIRSLSSATRSRDTGNSVLPSLSRTIMRPPNQEWSSRISLTFTSVPR